MTPCIPHLPLVALVAMAAVATPAAVAAKAKHASGSALFRTDAVAPLTLSFTKEQWDAVQAQGVPAGGMRGPGGPGGRPSLADNVAKTWFAEADANGDGAVSAEEWAALVDKRLPGWVDKESGKITAASLAAAPEFAMRGPGGPGGMVGKNGKNGMAAAMGVTFPYAKAAFTLGETTLPDVGVRFTGNNTFMSSRDAVRKPYKINFDKFVAKRDFDGVDKVNLRNNVNDPSGLNEVLSYALYEEAGVPAPRTGFVNLTVDVPGVYDRRDAGVYTVVENIDKTFLKERFGVKKSAPGALFKPSTRDLFGYLGDDWAKYESIYAPATDVTPEAAARVIDFAKLLKNAPDAEFDAALPGYVDLDNAARYLAVTVHLVALDSILEMGQNFYLYLEPKTNRFLLLPWDLDHTFGQWMRADTATLSIERPWSGDNRFLTRLFANAEFKAKYLKYVREFADTLFKPEAIAARVDKAAAVLRPAMTAAGEATLAAFENAVSDKPGATVSRELPPPPVDGEAPPFGAPPSGGDGPGGFPGGPGGMPRMNAAPIKVFAKQRAASVAAQLAGEPAPAPANGGRGGFPGGFPGNFGRATTVTFFGALDPSGVGAVAPDDARARLVGFYGEWDADKSAALSAEELTAALKKFFPEPARGNRGPRGQAGPGGRPGAEAPGAPGERPARGDVPAGARPERRERPADGAARPERPAAPAAGKVNEA